MGSSSGSAAALKIKKTARGVGEAGGRVVARVGAPTMDKFERAFSRPRKVTCQVGRNGLNRKQEPAQLGQPGGGLCAFGVSS